jgi:hypothetical protein
MAAKKAKAKAKPAQQAPKQVAKKLSKRVAKKATQRVPVASGSKPPKKIKLVRPRPKSCTG